MEPLRFDLAGCDSDGPIVIGRARASAFVIAHTSVSRKHATLIKHPDGRVEISDAQSSMGTYVNNMRVQMGFIREGDTVRFGNSPPFRFLSMQLVECPDLVGVAIRFEGLTLELGGRTILRDINAEIQPDEFVGIIGPSGSGKSTLLACLTGVYPPREGRIIFDGIRGLDSDLAYLLEQTGIVPQKDLIFEELTVRENLLFSARVKMPLASTGRIDDMVRDALEAVGMTGQAPKQVAVLSGGQRKRVNVAIELLQRPRLLLLDEPTSGLDPEMEARLFDKLGSLSRRGMTVICVAHTEDFRFFDKIICLRPVADGETTSIAFCGPPEGFEKLSGALNAADPGTGEMPPPTRSRQPPLVIRRNVAGGEHFLPQATTILQRTTLCLRRDMQAVCLTLVLPVAVAAMIVFSQKQQTSPGHICFFMVVTAFWLGMTAGVREIVKERKLYIRDKLSGLAPGAYFIGKSAYAVIVAVAQSVLLFVSVVLVFGVTMATTHAGGLQQVCSKLSFFSVAVSFVPLAFAAIGGALAGIMVSTFARTERMAVTTLPLILLPQILLSRIAYGEGGSSPFTQPPFGSVLALPQEGFLDGALYLVSLGFVTRPCSTAMSLCFKGDHPSKSLAEAWPTMVAAEWCLMVGLTALYFLIALVGFLRVEKKWSDWR